MPELFLGIDFGTSGVRTAVIDAEREVVAQAWQAFDAAQEFHGRQAQDPDIWWQALEDCLAAQRASLQAAGHGMDAIAALAVDGTSGTMLLVDEDLQPLAPALMYNSSGFDSQAELIAAVAPGDSLAQGAGSALARLLFLQQLPQAAAARHAHNQADWISARLMGRGGLADENNTLKTGYDPASRSWPQWLARLELRRQLLPQVRPVGARFGPVDPAVATRLGLAGSTTVMAGTTDSVAAFLASGVSEPGEAVTSLGTTMAIKLLCDQPVSDPARGIYSHRIKDVWLPGGASNTGGGALLKFFSADQMRRLEADLDPDTPTGLDYYPLPGPGERFPIADSSLEPVVAPRPDSDAQFFQGLLEGIASIELSCYQALAELGAPRPHRVVTTGGGAANAAWLAIRARTLGCEVVAGETDAAVGAAMIAAGS